MFYVVRDRDTDIDKISIAEYDTEIFNDYLFKSSEMKEAQSFVQRYEQERITKLIKNMFDYGVVPVFYFVTTMFISDKEEEYKHVVKQGFFSNKETAEKFLVNNWPMLHECWNNYGVIEEVKMGVADFSCWDIKQWWFKDKKAQEAELSGELIPIDRPKCTEVNRDMATMFAF